MRARLLLVMVMLCGVLAAVNATAQTILFDNAHGERFRISDQGPLQLSGLAQIFQAEGAQVGPLEQPISAATLSGVTGLVISGAFKPLSPEEVEALCRFLQKGGK